MTEHINAVATTYECIKKSYDIRGGIPYRIYLPSKVDRFGRNTDKMNLFDNVEGKFVADRPMYVRITAHCEIEQYADQDASIMVYVNDMKYFMGERMVGDHVRLELSAKVHLIAGDEVQLLLGSTYNNSCEVLDAKLEVEGYYIEDFTDEEQNELTEAKELLRSARNVISILSSNPREFWTVRDIDDYLEKDE